MTAKANTLQEAPSAPVVSLSETLNQAILQANGDPDALEKLTNTAMRLMDKQAEMEFNEALHGFQSELGPIRKNLTANTGSYSYDYASLDHILEHVNPVLSAHGLSATFNTAQNEGSWDITCIISHTRGHSRSTTIPMPKETGKQMNDPQKAGSGMKYGMRYALQLALGIAPSGKDDDGLAAGSEAVPPITDEQYTAMHAYITERGWDNADERLSKMASTMYKIKDGDIRKLRSDRFDHAMESLRTYIKQK